MPTEFAGDDDEVSGDEIDELVAGDDDEVGAKKPKKRKGGGMRQVPYGKTMFQLLGVTSTSTIAAAATANVIANPQTPFKAVRLVMRAPTSWDITDIKVGTKSQFVGSNAVPGDVFGATSTDVLLSLDTIQAMQNFVLQVTNNTGGALAHSTGALGPSAVT